MAAKPALKLEDIPYVVGRFKGTEPRNLRLVHVYQACEVQATFLDRTADSVFKFYVNEVMKTIKEEDNAAGNKG